MVGTLAHCHAYGRALQADLLQFGFSEVASSPGIKNIPLPPKAKSVA
jgi:hypothetical protein